MKIVILVLVLSCGSLLWAGPSMEKIDSDWRLIMQCVGTKEAPVPTQKALQCIADLKGRWPADSPKTQMTLLLESLLETHAKLEIDLTKKKEIIRILLEQIERIKMVDIEMEQRRQSTNQ